MSYSLNKRPNTIPARTFITDWPCASCMTNSPPLFIHPRFYETFCSFLLSLPVLNRLTSHYNRNSQQAHNHQSHQIMLPVLRYNLVATVRSARLRHYNMIGSWSICTAIQTCRGLVILFPPDPCSPHRMFSVTCVLLCFTVSVISSIPVNGIPLICQTLPGSTLLSSVPKQSVKLQAAMFS